MQQESWDFELETEADDNTKSAWHIVLDMTQPSWKLERRVQQALKQDAGDVSLPNLKLATYSNSTF